MTEQQLEKEAASLRYNFHGPKYRAQLEGFNKLFQQTAADQVFGQLKSPFAMLGEAVGNVAGAATSHSDNRKRLKAQIAELEAYRPQVSYMGIEDVQKHVQQSIGHGASQEAAKQLEVLKKQLEAEEKTRDGITSLPQKLAQSIGQTIAPMLGLQ